MISKTHKGDIDIVRNGLRYQGMDNPYSIGKDDECITSLANLVLALIANADHMQERLDLKPPRAKPPNTPSAESEDYQLPPGAYD